MSDYELGFVGAAVKAAGGLAKGLGKVGKAIKKKKQAKKKKGKVMVMPDINIEGQATKAIKEAAADASSPAEVVKLLVAALPVPIRQAVLSALKEAAATGAQREQTLQTISAQVDDALKPQIAAMLGALEAQQLSRQATHEHQTLVEKQQFRDGTTSALRSISDRLGQLEAGLGGVQARLGKVAILQPNKVALFGARSIFD